MTESNLPWFPLWATDFTNSRKVRAMPPEQVGVYILLLCHQWDGGAIADDEESLKPLVNGAEWSVIHMVLERCFEHTEEGWVNIRLEEIREQQQAKHDSKIRAGIASGKARRGKKLASSNAARTQPDQQEIPVPLLFEQSESELDIEETDSTIHDWPKKPRVKSNGQYTYPQLFEDAWTEYPNRDGGNPKRGAYDRFRSLVKSGCAITDLTASARHYRIDCDGKQKNGTEFVQMAQTFWGPREMWRDFVEPSGEELAKVPQGLDIPLRRLSSM